MSEKNKTFYIAGPMSGDYENYNFAMFDKVAKHLKDNGVNAISPADMDREVGFDPETDKADVPFLEEAMKRDCEAIMVADAIVMLPGWEQSTGARAELALAKWRHIDTWQWEDGAELVTWLNLTKDGNGNWVTVRHDAETPKDDPKKAAGSKKAPLHLMPPDAEELICRVLAHGADKYGPYNWRVEGGRLEMAVYVGALRRHLAAVQRGVWLDPDSGLPHLAHIGASCCVLLDADSVDQLDRDAIKPEKFS